MIKVLKNAQVFAPEPLGKKDVLIVGDKIARIADVINEYDNVLEAEVFDFENKILIPGYIDMHVHITGGGGEDGPASRVPESQLSVFLKNGITTVVGLLGTDGVTKSIENLIAKARALTEEGITVYSLTGSYGYPTITMTGSIEKDIYMLTPMIGVKVSASDHRSSNPQAKELIAIGTAARRGGMISGTAGLVTIHMGSGKGGLKPLMEALDNSDIPPKNFLPTHILRDDALIDDAAEYVRKGGYIDCTAGCDPESIEENADKLYELLGREGVALNHVTMSSDSYGSMPRFDENGNCVGLTYAKPDSLHETIKGLVKRGMAFEKAIQLLTSNSAFLLGKEGVKGCIKAGADADVLILDEALEINSLFAKGKVALLDGELKMRGRFEC